MGFLRNLFLGQDFKKALVGAALADAKNAALSEIAQLPAEEQVIAIAAIDLLIRRAQEKLV